MDFLPDGVAFNKNITYLAKTNFRAQEQVFGIKRKDRRQHMYVLGKSGSGKSVLLGNMIVQNIWNGEGVCVIDPHGELVESVLATIPAHRVKDVVYFNPADTDYHIGFNVLQVDDPKYKHLVASGLMGIFTKIWANAWSARMEYILNNAILALADTPGSTLLGIPRLLVDKDYRQVVINNLKDPVIKAFWIHEYENWRDQYRNEAIAPIQNKVGQFLSTSIVRNVVGQAKSTIDLFDMMNSSKIFLVNVSKGRIGEDNSALLGGMIITKLQLAAMERVRIPEDDRKDFYLYVDEFQNFVTDAFASILSEARKYRLNLTLAHQYIAQLVTKDSEAVRDAVFGNVGTMIIFRVGAADAEFLEQEFEPEFMVQDMVNLPNYTIYLKLMVDGVTSRPFSAKTLPPYKIPINSTVAQDIIESSRSLYARPRDLVEKEINDWSGMLVGLEQEGKFKAVCSSCGKETSVPFEPEAGRPVYCKECIAKIKSGEMRPLKGTRSESLKPQSYAALANLGIEFAAEAVQTNTPRPNPSVASRPNPMRPQAPVSPSIATSKASTPAPVKSSASRVPPRAPAPVAQDSKPSPAPSTPPARSFRPSRDRKGPDHDGLQSILRQALGDALNKNDTGAKMPQKVEETTSKVPSEERKTISLASLKKPELPEGETSRFTAKTASEERVSALQSAIARASTSRVVEIPVAPVTPVVPITPAVTIPEPLKPLPPAAPETPITFAIPKPASIQPEPVVREASLAPAIPIVTTFVPVPPAPIPQPTPSVIPEPQPSIQPVSPKEDVSTPPVSEAPKSDEKKAEETRSDTPDSFAPKRVREVPEDILRKVLNE
jgi:CxxC-x17-CxxC domain-containing protein